MAAPDMHLLECAGCTGQCANNVIVHSADRRLLADASDAGSKPLTCSFSPVNVDAIFQNLMCPVPHVTRCPGL